MQNRDVTASYFCCFQIFDVGQLIFSFKTSLVVLLIRIYVETAFVRLFISRFSLAGFLTLAPSKTLSVEIFSVHLLLDKILLLTSSVAKQPIASSVLHSSTLVDMMRPTPMVYKELPPSMIPPSYKPLLQLASLLPSQLSKVLFESTLHSLNHSATVSNTSPSPNINPNTQPHHS